MKVRAIRNFLWRDSLREAMVDIKIGDIFDVDCEKEPSEILEGLGSKSIIIIDPDFIPERGRYIGLHSFSEEVDGTRLKIVPGEVVTLSQVDASNLMALGYVKPEKESQWRPNKLITGAISKGPPKKMFDEEPPANWVKEYGVKGGCQ